MAQTRSLEAQLCKLERQYKARYFRYSFKLFEYNSKLSNDCLNNGKGLYLLNCSHTGTHLHCGSSSFYTRNLWAKVICCMLKSQSLWSVSGLYNSEHDLWWGEKGSVNMQFVMKHDPRFFWLFIPSAWVTSSSHGFWLVELFATKVRTFKIKCNIRWKFMLCDVWYYAPEVCLIRCSPEKQKKNKQKFYLIFI